MKKPLFKVFDHFLRFKNATMSKLAKAEQDLKETKLEAESIKMAAVQNYVEKEHIINELSSKIEKLESKIIFYEETQMDIQREREQMQRKIIDLATMLDKEAEQNERRRKELEQEINEKVEQKTLENQKKFEENKIQLIQMMQATDERMRKAEESELQIKRKLKQRKERYQREIEVFKKANDASPEKKQVQEESQQLVWKYEKKITEIIKEQEKEKEELREDLEKNIKEKEDLKRRFESLEGEMKRFGQEKTFILRKIDEKTRMVEENEAKFLSLKQEYTEKILEMEINFAEEKKTHELRMKSVESTIDDVFFSVFR